MMTTMITMFEKNRITTLVLLFTILAFCVSADNAAAVSPTDALRPVLEGIVEIIQDPVYAGEENKDLRREKIMEIAHRGFDFTTMSKLVLGKAYRRLNNEQRKNFVYLFTKLLENAYIGKLEGYTNQVTKYEGEQIKGKKAEVRTLVENKGITVPVSYIMLQHENSWQVYDIKIEGVRLLRNYKAQFKSILRKDTFEGLVKVLKKKNASFVKKGKS